MLRAGPRRVLPGIVPRWLPACAAGATAEPSAAPVPLPPSRIVNPCDAIRLPPRLDEDKRQALADEIAAAPASAVWPDVLRDAAGVARAVRACRTPA